MPSINLQIDINIPFIDLGERGNALAAMQIKKYVTNLIKEQTNIVPIMCEGNIEICTQKSEVKLIGWSTEGV